MQIIEGEITEVIADNGMRLRNKDGVTAHHVWLGNMDSVSNWTEELDEEEPEPSDDERLAELEEWASVGHILLGQ